MTRQLSTPTQMQLDLCSHADTWSTWHRDGKMLITCNLCGATLKTPQDARPITYPNRRMELNPEPITEWQYIPELDGMTTPPEAPNRGEYNGFVWVERERPWSDPLTRLQVVTPTGYTYDTCIMPEEWSLPQ